MTFSINSPEGRNYGYDITQKLTYFVITAELVFCGYLLLNADKLVHFKSAPLIFVLSGMSAGFGLCWRFCYNITYHAHAHTDEHDKKGYFDKCSYKLASCLQGKLHNTFVLLSASTLILGLYLGHMYILNYKTLVKAPEQLQESATSTPTEKKNITPSTKARRSGVSTKN